jgi:hypothetical protein
MTRPVARNLAHVQIQANQGRGIWCGRCPAQLDSPLISSHRIHDLPGVVKIEIAQLLQNPDSPGDLFVSRQQLKDQLIVLNRYLTGMNSQGVISGD